VKCLWSCSHPGADCNSVESGAVGAVADRAPKGVRKNALLMTGYRARLQWAGSTQMQSALVASLRRREKECDHPFATKRIVRPRPRQCTFLIAEERLGDLRLRFQFTPPIGQSGDEVSTRGIVVGRTLRHQARCLGPSKLQLNVELAKPRRFACFAPDLHFHPAPGGPAERLDDRAIREHAGRNGDLLRSLADKGDVDRFRDSPGE
jgi:hypothetical protein